MIRAKAITIVGGGLSGLICSLVLNRAGFEVTLIEKKNYPFHRVCGEYISNETRPFFKSIGINLERLSPSNISQLAISSPTGRIFKTVLDLGGFGLSRFTLDNFLYQKAKDEGINVMTGIKVNNVEFADETFYANLSDNSTITANLVISAHGKRSNLDKDRKLLHRRSPYLGVKYHIRTDFPADLVQLDNFHGGYCGTVKIEGDRFNLCYLSDNSRLKKLGSIEELERQILFKNPLLKNRFLNSDFLSEKPEVINEISFEQKPLVEKHILYCGDAAGMISPLCGNGMAMAIHSAKILSEIIKELYPNRNEIERTYQKTWKQLFANRLITGRLTQRLFGESYVSGFAVDVLNWMPTLASSIIKRTHGNPF